jgi:putative MATE family efflux protein
MTQRGGVAASLGADEVAPAREPGTYRRIWQIAWPVSISTSTVTLLTLANLFWIGHLGTEAVAAVSLCGNLLFSVFGIASVVQTGALAIIARRVGEGNLAHAFSATLHGILLGLALGTVVAVAGYAAAPAVVHFFGAAPEVERIAIEYLRVMLLGQVPFFVTLGLGAAYQAAGDTRTPMLVNVGVVVLNAVADPFLIFAPGQLQVAGFDLGLLGYGAVGGAIAASLCGLGGCILLLAVSFVRKRPFARPAHAPLALSFAEFWHMLRIGAPSAVSMAARPLSTFLLLKIIAGFGTAAIAAFGIALRSFSVNWIPYSGINVAVASLVGRNLGAHKVEEAERVVWRGLVVTGLLGVVYAVVYFAAAEPLVRIFDDEPAVIAAGVPFLQLMALSFLFSGPTIPMGSAMNGAGDTKPPMIIAFVVNWPVKLPLSYALALPLGWGIEGVWVGMFVSLLLESVLLAWWYRRGGWKAKRV